MKGIFASKVAIAALVVGVAAAVVGIVALVNINGDKKDEYRSIQVYEVDGTAEIDRAEIGVLEPYANMALQSEDEATTFTESYLQLKLDDDKYVLAEPETVFGIVATGTSEDSRTTIELRQGAVVNSIENALSSDSVYEVNTPNSTMAVRGTRFRVTCFIDEDGVLHTRLDVMEGQVECHLVFPDGTIDPEAILVEAGRAVGIWGDDKESAYEFLDGEVEYGDLDQKVLDFLKFCIEEGGAELSISLEELEELIEEKESETETETETGTELETETETGTELTTEPTTEGESESTSESSESESSENSESSSEEGTEGSNQETVTVTFMYGETVFGTQTIAVNTCPSKPTIQPTSDGYWDYNFSQAVTSGVTINWVEQ